MTFRYAVLFPGQGSQFVGMGAELFEARSDLLGEAADRVLGWSLRSVCLEGSEEELTRTEHAQPALFAVTYALWRELEARLPLLPAAAGGHSLGEYTALAAAGAIGYLDALAVVAERGRAMAEAADAEASGMAALLGADLEAAEAITTARRKDGGRLYVANINAPGQIVVAGGKDDIEWLVDNSRELGVRRVVPLKVAGAFHSPFMQAASERLAEMLGGLDARPPAFEVYCNVTAAPMEAGETRQLLAAQVVSPVRFSETISRMASTGIGIFVHVGPGDVTAGMARRAAPDCDVLVVSDLDGIAPAAEALSTMAASGGD